LDDIHDTTILAIAVSNVSDEVNALSDVDPATTLALSSRMSPQIGTTIFIRYHSLEVYLDWEASSSVKTLVQDEF
jgi:hypothetical protein